MNTKNLLFAFVLFWLSFLPLSAQVIVSANTIIQDTLLAIIQKNSLDTKTVTTSGQVQFSSNSGYVRILLSDDYGYDLLVYESFPLIAVDGIDNFNNVALETVNIPSSLALTKVRVEIRNAELRNLSVDMSTINLFRTQQQTKADKITLINSNLRNQKALWVAGETEVSKMSYEEKKGLFGGKVPDLQGFEYYIGGIFELHNNNEISNKTNKSLKVAQSASSNDFVSVFDWRNRHGKNWNTSVKSQFGGTCWAFGSTASTEALTNLYYNRKLDMDLSEGELVACVTSSNCNGGYSGNALDYIASTGIVNQDCFPNGNCNAICSDKCLNPIERIRINSKTNFYPNSYTDPESELKKRIIAKGVICSDVWSWSHTMALSGFGLIQENDTIYSGTTSGGYNIPITILSGDSRIGTTYWIFKNSWGIGWGENGYAKIMLDVTNQYIYGRILNLPITSLNYTDSDIVCDDRDGDGYYFWGIGTKPTHCPACAPDEPDGDDSNPNLGPMDEYGYCAEITPLVENITSSQTWNTDRTICRNVVIQSGAILTITATAFASTHKITIQNGGTLIVSGGTVDDGNIIAQNGSALTLSNNGKLILGSYDNLDVQLGATFDFSYGEVLIK
ncbi:MAG: C1 family peptidase [Bacteroidales bacterium]|jgi:hypothetical protein|nr:C1 family peptidase [Bacteroidales bacterium]